MLLKDNILILGSSGVGKSTSLRNLKGDRVIVLNTERKRLPFPDKEFTRQFPIDKYNGRRNSSDDPKEFYNMFRRALASDPAKTDAIVIESFTSLCEMIMITANMVQTGFDVYRWYAEEMFQVLYDSKNSDKHVVMIAIDEIVDLNGEMRRRTLVEGKKQEGKVEKEFTIVLYADMIQEGDEMKHIFRTNNPRYSAKSPVGMFDPIEPNDLNHIINKIKAYRGE